MYRLELTDSSWLGLRYLASSQQRFLRELNQRRHHLGGNEHTSAIVTCEDSRSMKYSTRLGHLQTNKEYMVPPAETFKLPKPWASVEKLSRRSLSSRLAGRTGIIGDGPAQCVFEDSRQSCFDVYAEPCRGDYSTTTRSVECSHTCTLISCPPYVQVLTMLYITGKRYRTVRVCVEE